MDFVESLRALLRSWLVVVIGMLCTGGAAAYIITQVPTEYQAAAQYVLVQPPGSTGTKSPTNPYLNISGGQGFVATLIASDMKTKSQQRSMVDEGFRSDYSLEQGVSGGPLLDVVVVGTDPADVIETRDELLRRFDERLSSLQDFSGIPSNQLIDSFTNAVDPVAEVVPGAKKKALILVAPVGAITTLVLAFVIDGWRRRARARKGK